MLKKNIIYEILIIFVFIPTLIFAGICVFSDRKYLLISFAVAVSSVIPFLISFEKKANFSKKAVLLAVMTALSIVGRALFAPLPFFKPVTAIVVLCGMELGCESGFLCGAMSALISNFMFMQGPWTPFQMFIWGSIGFVAGLMSGILKKSRIFLLIYGALSGLVYSAFMDIWTTMWWDGRFNILRYISALVSAIPITAIYAVSNIIFLLVLSKPITRKLERICKKYNL